MTAPDPTLAESVSTARGAVPSVAAVDAGSGSPVAMQSVPRPSEAGRPDHRPTRPVWDLFVRVFHWLLVAGVSALVVSAHLGKQEIHMALGLAVLALLAGRLVWGFVARNPFARFDHFAVSPFEAMRYLGEIVRGQPRHYVGHNPAGAWMVFALLGLLFALGFTGLVLQATVEFEGPFVDLLRGLSDPAVREIAIAHELAVNALYLLVPLHLAGVFLASRQHRENLVLSMITGRKKVEPAAHSVSMPNKE